MPARATTFRIDPKVQASLENLSRLLKRPMNRLVNEAVKDFVSLRSRDIERHLEATLESLRSFREPGPDIAWAQEDRPIRQEMRRLVRPSEALRQHRAAILRVIESHRVRNARVFGSVLTGEDTERSDLDLLVDPTSETTLFDIGAIRSELRNLLGVPVDVLTPKALPDDVRASVLAQARPI